MTDHFLKEIAEHRKRVNKIMEVYAYEIADKSNTVKKVIQQVDTTPIQEYIEQQKRVSKHIEDSVSKLGSRIKNSASIEAVKNINPTPAVKKMTPAIEAVKLAMSNMVEVTEHWKKLIKERELTEDELSKLLSDSNYPPVFTESSTSSLKELNEQLNKLDDYHDKIAMLDQYIVESFNEKYIDETLEAWGEMTSLNGRFHIIEEIVKAHKQKLYSLSTLAIFPQIEGILAETFPELRNRRGNFNGELQKKAFKSVLDIDTSKFDNVWSSYYSKNILKGFQHSEPIDYLSRHALAHGADKSYGTIVNSTKSLMIFDYIIYKIELYKRFG